MGRRTRDARGIGREIEGLLLQCAEKSWREHLAPRIENSRHPRIENSRHWRASLYLIPKSLPFSVISTPVFVTVETLQSSKMPPTELQNHSSDIKEPSPKIPKLQENNIPSPLLRVKRLSENAVLPSRGSPLSAGYDLSSASVAKVPARGKSLIPTDLSIAIPEGTYARIAPRSGLTWKHSIDVGAGVIDADYRGPVGVILFNHSDVDFEVKIGDRIAQLIIEKIVTPDVMEVEDLDATMRGARGFGSTGV